MKYLKKKISISIHNEYDVGSKRLIEEVRFYNDSENLHESKTKEISKIKEYLKKYDISIKDLKETADELLYEKVIGDWEKYAKSRFSKDNLGKVKIERSPLFDGVDQGKFNYYEGKRIVKLIKKYLRVPYFIYLGGIGT